jgi:biotin carboxylase
VLGVHEKLMYAPPSFAMRGSTFVPHCASTPVAPEVERYVRALLDAVAYDWGATHIEIMLTAEGPRLIEINPRLVGAKMPRLVSHTLGRSMHADLIALHLGVAPAHERFPTQGAGSIRWVVADRRGTLQAVRLPGASGDHIRCAEMLKQPGDAVCPPFENADRLGYVMACAADRATAEAEADAFVAQTAVIIGSTVRAAADVAVAG